jgi:hypothetical protein
LQDWQEKKPWKTEVKALYDKGIKLRFFTGKWRSSTQLHVHILNDLTLQDWQEKKPWKTEVKALYDKGIKLRFFAGKWRSSNGEAFHLSR